MTTTEESTEAAVPGGATRRGMGGKSGFLLLSLCVLWLDQWTKGLIEASYPFSSSREIIPGLLNFTHVRNTGVAFGLFAAKGDRTGTILLTALGLVALTVVGIYFWKAARHERTLLLSLSLILGGALGNLIDRIATGSVTDFIDFYVGSHHWHTFNVADSAISIGIVLMAIDIFWPGRATGGNGRESPS